VRGNQPARRQTKAKEFAGASFRRAQQLFVVLELFPFDNINISLFPLIFSLSLP
jgi:hypothetical protein